MGPRPGAIGSILDQKSVLESNLGARIWLNIPEVAYDGHWLGSSVLLANLGVVSRRSAGSGKLFNRQLGQAN